MYKEEDMTPSEKALESALGQLKPISNSMNRDELMFKAGRMSAGSKRPWQIFSSALTILLFCSVLFRSSTSEISNKPIDDSIQIAQVRYQPSEIDSYDSMAYPILRENIIRNGWEALQFSEPAGNNESVINQKELLDSMLSS